MTPLIIEFRSFLKGLRGRFGDVGCGDDCEDPSGAFCPGEVDQTDLPRVRDVPEHGAQGHPVGRDRV